MAKNRQVVFTCLIKRSVTNYLFSRFCTKCGFNGNNVKILTHNKWKQWLKLQYWVGKTNYKCHWSIFGPRESPHLSAWAGQKNHVIRAKRWCRNEATRYRWNAHRLSRFSLPGSAPINVVTPLHRASGVTFFMDYSFVKQILWCSR